jgi:uncharacterized damage-inducible protein DinB
MTTTPHPSTAPLLLIFSINTNLLSRVLDGLSPEDFVRPAGERNNCIAWVAGHVLQTRAQMLTLLGAPFDIGWGSDFGRGAVPPSEDRYPSRERMQEVAAELGARLRTCLSSLDEETLAAAAKGPQLPGVTSTAEQVGFFAMHDSYHVGQLGFMRKALGYPSLVG